MYQHIIVNGEPLTREQYNLLMGCLHQAFLARRAVEKLGRELKLVKVFPTTMLEGVPSQAIVDFEDFLTPSE